MSSGHSRQLSAEIIAVGSELLTPFRVDTNSLFVTGRLNDVGIPVRAKAIVGDSRADLASVFRAALERSDVVVLTGGLGPTEDDVTREAISALLGEEMVVQPKLEADLRAYFARRGRAMTQSNLKQATLIAPASAIANPVGTAPGWWVEKDGHIIVSMPGVPREMYRMWSEEVVPHLKAHHATGDAIIVSRTVKLLGLGESLAEDKIRHLLASTNPTIGTYAKSDGIHLRLTAKAATEAEARALIAPLELKLQVLLDTFIYGYDSDTPASVVAGLLIKRGLTLACLETCTGGHVASSIMNDPRYPDFFKAGFVAPTQQALLDFGVPSAVLRDHAPASMAVAEAMAAAVRSRVAASIGIGVTGVMPDAQWSGAGSGAGQTLPGETGGAIAPGTVNVALNDGGSRTSSLVFPTIPAEVKRWAMLNALNLIRLRLIDGA